jgi:hypothetical protein
MAMPAVFHLLSLFRRVWTPFLHCRGFGARREVPFHFAQAETPCFAGGSKDGMRWDAPFFSHFVDGPGRHAEKSCDLLGSDKRFHSAALDALHGARALFSCRVSPPSRGPLRFMTASGGTEMVPVSPFAQKKSSDTRTRSPLENPLNAPPDTGNSASLAGQLS